jgi:hypothetical protein
LIRAIACLLLLTAYGANNSLFAASHGSISSSSCKVWEVRYSETFLKSGGGMNMNSISIEAGWEPFALSAQGWMAMRRYASSP